MTLGLLRCFVGSNSNPTATAKQLISSNYESTVAKSSHERKDEACLELLKTGEVT